MSKFKNHMISNLLASLIIGLFVGLMGGLFSGEISVFIIIPFAYLFVPLPYFIIIALFNSSVGLEIKTIPNQGIWNCLSNTRYLLVRTFPIVVVLMILPNLISFPEDSVIYAISQTLAFPLFTSVCFGLAAFIPFLITLAFTYPAMQHFRLRLVLYFTGKIPWNYARFLDYATERGILQRVGGGYRFIHRYLQEHFASIKL